MSTYASSPATPSEQEPSGPVVRADNVRLVTDQQGHGPTGTLTASDNAVWFQSEKETVYLAPVRRIHYSAGDGCVHVEYGGDGKPMLVGRFFDLSRGTMHGRAAGKELTRRLESVLTVRAWTAVERSDITKARRSSGAKYMLGGAALFCVGLVVTLATYSNAEGGGRYLLWWGPMLFGLLLFLQGVFSMRRAR